MRNRAAVLFCLFFLLSAGLYARKKKIKLPAVPVIPQMTADRKVLHALNRLTFGARPGDVEQAGQIGLEAWIEQQLDPESIPENPVLEARLQPLDSLRMTTVEMLRSYPSPQMLMAMMNGRMALPDDPTARAAVKLAISRHEKRKGLRDAPAAEENPRQTISELPLTDDEKQMLRTGTPEERVAMLRTLPPDKLMAILEAIPQGLRGKLAPVAPPDLRRRIEILNAPMQVVNRDLTEGKLLRAIYSHRQLEQVLTDFWYNHFNVYLDKGADRSMVTSYERDVIRPRVLGKFKNLLVATAESPAMLFYLDNWQSVAPDAGLNPNRTVNPNRRRRGLNENYARELMELHTLGVDGGYTQTDVTEVARCFTGWTIRQPRQGGEFWFNERLHDKGEKHVLGVPIPASDGMNDGMNDGLKVLDILAHHPATARFIAKSLAIRFVSDDPPAPLVDKMTATFLSSDGDLREVMRTMVKAPEFWDPANFRSKVKSPLEMVASAVRAVNADVDTAAAMAGIMNQLGEPLYRKQEPTGYSNRGADWMNSASLLARMNFSNALAQGRIPGVRVDAERFVGEPQQIERNILLTDASPEVQAAIQAGLAQPARQVQPGPLAAALTLASPDFQRR
jgi:uncharacterized protein (DUF1800 family)